MVWLYSFWRGLCRRFYSAGAVALETAFVSELPSELRTDTVYVITEDGEPWSVAMICPCGCREVLYMSLLDGSPCWALSTHRNGTSSLAPSVWRTRGCRSHFFLRRGRIVWCPKSTGVR
jgi:hypothetical protein